MGARTMIGVAAVALAGRSALGADLPVPSKQYPTIQSAVNAAVDGDTIVIAAGTFTETAVVDNKSLSFRGVGANQTIWRAPSGARCLWSLQTSNKPISVSDIRFVDFNMPYNAAAVDLEAIAPHSVRRCRFENCAYFALEVFGPGVLVEDCEFSGTVGGSAVSASRSDGVQHLFRRCVFRDNRFEGYWWACAAMDIYLASVRLEGCYFKRNNFPVGNGIAIRVVASDLVLSNTRFCESGPSPIIGGWTDGGGNTFTTASCAPPCPADLVDDNDVNGADLAIILVAWGTNGSQYPGADLDDDGVVNGSDLATVLAAWGPCPQ